MSSRPWIQYYFDFCICSWEIIDILFPHLKKTTTYNFGFHSDIIKASAFKFNMIITFCVVHIVIVGLMTLTLIQGHRCVRNIKCNFRVLDSCPLYFKRCMVATYMKRIMHSIICLFKGEKEHAFLSVKCLSLSKTLISGFSQTPWMWYMSNFAWWYNSLSFTYACHFQWFDHI